MDKKRKLTSEEIRSVQMNILSSFDVYCKQHNLRYSIAGGTLLGAVRHEGYIPWDDDIDVVMERKDYDRLIELVASEKISENIRFDCLENSDTIYPFGKLYNTSTYTVCPDSLLHKGIWVDVFPLDCCNDNMFVVKSLRILRQIVLAKSYQKKVNHGFAKHLAKWAIKIATFLIPTRFFSRLINRVARNYGKKNKGSRIKGNIVWGYGEKEVMDYSIMDELVYYKFEGYQYLGFKNFDHYLSKIYGNYMILPPEEQRVIHGFDAWTLE